ncbi:MAG: hypothetical protein WCL27_06925 [Betaproteobacteria bacterium]
MKPNLTPILAVNSFSTAKDLFKPHGGYEPRVEGQILIATVSGSWNIEMHMASNEMARPLAEKLNSAGSWGVIVVIQDTLVSSLEVLKAGRQSVPENPNCSNLLALAWVIDPHVEGYRFMLDQYKQMYEGLLFTDVFSTLEQARIWMLQKLP